MEIWDVYDEHRKKKPYTHVRGVPLAEGDWHLVVEVWTATPEGQLLLTQRHPAKPYGGLWECTGGSAQQGEDSLTAVRRELEEETGLRMGETQPTLLCTTWHHHAIVDTYAVRLPFSLSDVTFQEGETVDARLVDFSFLEDPANEALIPEPVRERLRTAGPLLRRFLSGGEQWTMCDMDGQPLGYTRLRAAAGQTTPPFLPGEQCLGAEIWLIDGQNHLLVTQRAPGKSHPGQWECTGGGVHPGETPLQAVVREVYEEIGLDICGQTPRLLARIPGTCSSGPCLIHTFGLKLDFQLSDLHLQAEEVSQARLADLSQVRELPLVSGVRAGFERVQGALLALMQDGE